MTTPRLLTLILFIAIFTMAVRLPADTDTWWHLRAGQYIVENRIIPTTDPFSHTRAGEAWIDHGWLAQVFWYGLFAIGGWPGLSLGLAVLITVTFWLVWLVTPGNPFIRAFVTLAGAITSAVIWVARPQMVSFMLAGLILFLLEKYKRTASNPQNSKRFYLYPLPFILFLWGNIHGGYAIAFMLIAAYLVGETLNHLSEHTTDPILSWREMRLLIGVAIISFLAVAINPHGWQMWLYPFRTVGIGALRDFIQEWRSPDFHQPMTWPFVGMALLTLIAIGRAPRLADWSDLVLLGMWASWSLFAGRNIGLYGLLTVPALARYADAAMGHYLPMGEGSSAWKNSVSSRNRVSQIMNGALLGLIVVAALLKIGVALSPQARDQYLYETLPNGAVKFIQTNRPTGPIFNSYNWGGYLIFTLWPNYPVYIDGRTDLYDDAFLRRYVNVMVANKGWQQILNDDNINLVLVETNSTLAKFLRLEPNWKEIYQDETAVVFSRQ